MKMSTLERKGHTLTLRETVRAALQEARLTLSGELPATGPASVRYGRYIDAPVWPWFAAGWILAAAYVVGFFIARLHA